MPILKPLTSNEFTVKDFFYFAEEVIYQELGFFMSSLDVHLLFTNIPLEDTIEICPNKLFLWLLKIYILFLIEHFNKQIDGVAIGSQLGHTLANAFLVYCQKNWLGILCT